MPRPDHDLAWAMYHVVRSDRRLSFAQAMALGGAGAVACADRFRDSERWAANFAAWQAAAYPKVAPISSPRSPGSTPRRSPPRPTRSPYACRPGAP